MARVLQQLEYCERVRMYLGLPPREFSSWMIQQAVQYHKAGYMPFWAAWCIGGALKLRMYQDEWDRRA